MTVIGNILWFLFGGLIGGLAWVLAGCLWCVTIIGIPVGLQCFKFASLAFFPFGKEVIYGGRQLEIAVRQPLKAVLQDGEAVADALRRVGDLTGTGQDRPSLLHCQPHRAIMLLQNL